MEPINFIQRGDAQFATSPDAGDPECRCSRCGLSIGEDECPLRAWSEGGHYEYRYCTDCQRKAGFDFPDDPNEDVPEVPTMLPPED